MAERYAAFISYSHRDRRLAAWLHRKLEGYRVPRALVGKMGADGPVPARIAPVFRDRDDLSVSADLGATVREALGRSDALIVVCSPAAAHSRWVDQEIVEYKRRVGDRRLFALVIAGEPLASTMPGGEADECFPPALRARAASAGELAATVEPMAADLREEGDGRRLALLKLIAGLLGVPLDALVQRENVRRQRSLGAIAAAAVVGMLAMGGLSWNAIAARDEARAGRADAEKLVEFMLGDLRGRLEGVGRLDIMDAVGNRALDHYARQRPDRLDAQSLARRARALQMVGELRSLRGEFDDADRAFAAAAATTAELLTREPDDGQRIFNHAQSVFWLGSNAYQRGRLGAAREAFDEYARLSDRLIAIDPARDDWRAEVGHSRINQGVVLIEQRQPDEAAAAFARAGAVFGDLMRRAPASDDWPPLYAQANAWLADAERSRFRLDAAVAARGRELAIHRRTVAARPDDNGARAALARSLHATGDLALARGDVAKASTALGESAALYDGLLAVESGNVEWLRKAIAGKQRLSEAQRAAGDMAGAARTLAQTRRTALRLVDRDPSVPAWKALQALTEVLRAELAEAQGQPELAREFATAGLDALEQADANAGGTSDTRYWRARANVVLGRLAADEASARPRFAVAAAMLTRRPVSLPPDESCTLAEALAGLGRAREAGSLAKRLRGAGYRDPVCRLASDTPASVTGKPGDTAAPPMATVAYESGRIVNE